ncbi:hypothetical protein YC2023_041356 [Brassica napus]
MLVLLKSGQSALQEEAVEEMKDCRSMKQQWCRSDERMEELHQSPPGTLLVLDITDSAQKSIDISSCDPTSDGDIEITMEDFLELEEFLELEDAEKLEDLDSSREVSMEDFLELEEWLEDIDQNSKKKLDNDQHTSRGDLETSPNASIDRHQPDGIDRQPPHIIDQRPPYIIDQQSSYSIDLHPHSSGQSASQEEAVEEMNDCRSMKQHWCRSTVIPEYGLSIFYDR